MPHFHSTDAALPDGRLVHIDTHVLQPGGDEALMGWLITCHPEAAMVTHGLMKLFLEGQKYLDRGPYEQLAHDYEQYDLSHEERFVSFAVLTSRGTGKPHVAGMLVWQPMTSSETLIMRLYVAKQFRRFGVATTLVLEAIHQMEEQGYAGALAFVQQVDKRAGSFLASRDFRRVICSRRNAELYVLDLLPRVSA